MTARRVAVIGAGLAGLAAAARLRQLGVAVRVFERANAVGGVVRTVREDGWTIDTGAAMAAEPGAAVRELLDLAGLGLLTQRAAAEGANRYIVLDGKPVVMPRTAGEFSSSSLLSLGGRLRLLKERFIPARAGDSEETVDSFARRRFGDEMADRMFDPLMASTSAGDPKQTIARFAFPSLVGHESRASSALQGSARARMEARRRARGRPTGSWSCTGGMQRLPEQLGRWVGDVTCSAAVARVDRAGDGVRVVFESGGSETYSAAVIATPSSAAAGLVAGLAGEEGVSFGATPAASIAAVSLGFRREQVAHPLDGSRLLVPAVERRRILSMVFPAGPFPDRAPAGHVLITAFVGGARQAGIMQQSDAELVALVHEECCDLLGARGEPVVTRVTRWDDALPQAVAGHAARIDTADGIETRCNAIAFTGAWRDGLSIGDVLLGGMTAADRLAGRLQLRVE